MVKQTRVSFKLKNFVSEYKPLKLLCLYIFGLWGAKILGGNYYDFFIIDDYTIFTWTLFSAHKEYTFIIFVKLVQNHFYLRIISLRSDLGGEFVNHHFENFCNKNSITRNLSCTLTSQQNGVVECKNRILEELA